MYREDDATGAGTSYAPQPLHGILSILLSISPQAGYSPVGDFKNAAAVRGRTINVIGVVQRVDAMLLSRDNYATDSMCQFTPVAIVAVANDSCSSMATNHKHPR